MPKTLQVRDVDDEDYAVLAQRAARAGVSVPELLRREISRMAARPSLDEWLDRTRRRPSTITTRQVLDDLDDGRGPWPGEDD